MTNGEKYKTAKERAEAFDRFCKNNTTDCGMCMPDCKLFYVQDDEKSVCGHCEFAWLDLEAEEEKPLPCPFCGGKTIVRRNWNSTNQVVCNSQGCWYCSKCESTELDAIAAHNRVAKPLLLRHRPVR